MPDTPKEARFRDACRTLLERGIKPTPMKLHKEFPDEKFINLPSAPHRGPTLSGNLSIIRREEFARAGWKQEWEGATWFKPGS